MKKKFIESLGLVLFLNILIKPFWIFGIDRTVQNIVGPNDYGVYFTLFNFSLILNIILDLGLTNYNSRNISRYQFLLSKHFSNIVVVKFLLAIIYFIVIFIVALVLKFSWADMKLLSLLAFNQFLLSFILYLRSNLTGMHLFKTDSFVSVLDRLLMVVICSVLLWGNVTNTPFQIEWFVYTQTASYLITMVIVFGLVWSNAEFFKPHFDLKFLRVILRKSIPYALLILLMAFYYRVDTVMLSRMLPDGDFQSGIYAQGFRVLDAVSMFAFLFSGLLLPIFSHMIKKNEKVDQIVSLSIVLLLVPIILISITSFFYRCELMDLLYHHDILSSAQVFGVLILALIPIASSYIFGTLLTANGSLKQLNIMAFSGMVLNISLNLILIPIYKAFGSAVASIITQVIVAIIQIYLSYKLFNLRFNVLLIGKFLLFTLFIIVLSLILKKIQLNWIWEYTAIFFIGFGFANIIRLFSIKGLFHILKYEKN